MNNLLTGELIIMWAWIRTHGKKIAIGGGIVLLIGLTVAIPPLGMAGWIAEATLIAVDVVVSIGVSVAIAGTALTVAGIAGAVTEVQSQESEQRTERLQQRIDEQANEMRALLAQAGGNQINNNTAQNTNEQAVSLERLDNLEASNQQVRIEINNQNKLLNGMCKTDAQQHNETIAAINALPAQVAVLLGQSGIFSANNPTPVASPKAPGASDLVQRQRGFSPTPIPY